MGIIKSIKKLWKKDKKHEKAEIEEADEDKPYKQDPYSKYVYSIEPVESVVKKKQKMAESVDNVGQQVESVDENVETSVKSVESADKQTPTEVTMTNMIKSWQSTVKAAQEHPLSQVKIMNTRILEDLSNVLKQMNLKLDKLDELDKLDIILSHLIETKDELKKKGVDSEKLKETINVVENLTIKDKDVLNWIAQQEKVTASELADHIGLSRSTASFRLNRLADMGTLIKESEGKKVFYKVNKESLEELTGVDEPVQQDQTLDQQKPGYTQQVFGDSNDENI